MNSMEELDKVSNKYCKEYWAEQDKELYKQMIEALRRENYKLKEQLTEKDKQLAIREKALELICYYMEYKYWKKDDDI